MNRFQSALASDRPVVTCELNPPKGTDLDALYEKASLLDSRVDAFNVTDSAGSTMTMAPIAAAHLLIDRGIEPILQITGRDRNRIAVQSELLAAAALGVRNVLCMSGDPPGAGDHPDAKAVFDMDAIAIVKAVSSLTGGADMSGAELSGKPDLNPGAVANPGADDLDKELRIVRAKVPGVEEKLARQVCRFVEGARGIGLDKVPGISESLDWARAMVVLHLDHLDHETVERTLGTLIKDADDLERFRREAIDEIIAKI